MGWMTPEQIEQARAVHVLDYVLRYEPDKIHRVGSGYRLKDHPSISIDENGWYRHSHELGGITALDYLTFVRGYGLVDAVCMLINEKPLDHPPPDRARIKAPTRKVTPTAHPSPSRPQATLPMAARRPPSLPPRNANNARVIAYLQSRGIDRQTLCACIKDKSLYQSEKYSNCVFVGFDDNGIARYGALRGTWSNFKCDVEGSDKSFGFVIPPNNPNSDTVAVFEAPIDCLSHQTLCRQGYIEPFDGWRLSLGGTALAALRNFLERHTSVTNCLVCTDNDEAGELAAAKIAKLPGITSERRLPVSGSDWNEGLLALQKAERLQNRVHRGNERG